MNSTELATRRHYHSTGGTFVPALPARRPPATVELIDGAALLPPATHTGHARQDDDALTLARATLLVSVAYVVAAGLITVGLMLIVWLFRALGDGFAVYAYGGLIVWGLAVLAALWGNRKQALWHSATGIGHHELDSRERVAMHAIDTHAALLRARWELDHHDD